MAPSVSLLGAVFIRHRGLDFVVDNRRLGAGKTKYESFYALTVQDEGNDYERTKVRS